MERGQRETTYVMFHPFDNDADAVQQGHLRLRQLNLLDERHEPAQDVRSVGQERGGGKLPLIRDVLELSACRHAYHLVVARIFGVEQVRKDLVHHRPLGARDLDGRPLAEEDGNATAKHVEARPLSLDLDHESRGQKGVKVELGVQHRCRQSDRAVDGVLEEDVVRRWRRHGAKYLQQRLHQRRLEVDDQIEEELLRAPADRVFPSVTVSFLARLPFLRLLFPVAQIGLTKDEESCDDGLHDLVDQRFGQELALHELDRPLLLILLVGVSILESLGRTADHLDARPHQQ